MKESEKLLEQLSEDLRCFVCKVPLKRMGSTEIYSCTKGHVISGASLTFLKRVSGESA